MIDAWKKYYSILLISEDTVDKKERSHLKLDLLAEIAISLGYENLKQTDIDKFYLPIVHYDDLLRNHAIQHELLSYLSKSNRFYDRLEEGATLKIEPNKDTSQSNQNSQT